MGCVSSVPVDNNTTLDPNEVIISVPQSMRQEVTDLLSGIKGTKTTARHGSICVKHSHNKKVKLMIVAASNKTHNVSTDVFNICNFWKEKSAQCDFSAYVLLDKQCELPVSNVSSSINITIDNFNAGIIWLTKDINPDDLCIFHYLGNGRVHYDLTDKNLEGVDCYLTFADGKEIKDIEMREYLVDKLPKGSTLISVIDACNAGTILDLKYEYQDNSYLSEKMSPDVTIFKESFKKGTNVFKPFRSANYVQSSSSLENPFHQNSSAAVYSFGTCLEMDSKQLTDFDNFDSGALTWACLNSFENNFKNSLKTVIKDINILLKQLSYEQTLQFSSGNNFLPSEEFSHVVGL